MRNNLPGNPHAERLANGHVTGTQTEAAPTQADATMALAYEQRTSNLIDMLTLLHLYEVTATHSRTKAMPNTEQKIQGQLLARLGLKEDA